MSVDDVCYLTAAEALCLFRERRLSPVELMEACLARIEATQGGVNAYSFLYAEEALAAARAAERRYGERSAALRPLEGLPCAFKDENLMAGKVTSFGSLIYRDWTAPTSAPVVERLLAAGAIAHGRTTTPEFSCTPFTYSRIWGTTRNPWNPAFTPGGSSGGAGAALASGTTPLATGSDIGGSIRIPASASGVVGYKPPYGRNPATPPFNLDTYNHPGPMARSVEDCLLMQNVMSGPSEIDVASLLPKVVLAADRDGIKDWRIAYSPDLGYFEVDDEVRRNTEAALEVLTDLGAVVEEVDLGWGFEVEAAAKAHLRTIFGQWLQEPLRDHGDLLCGYTRLFAEESQTATAQDFYQSIVVEAQMYAKLHHLFGTHRLLVCPTLALPALPAEYDRRVDGTVINGREVDAEIGTMMTYPFNMVSRCPVLSVPSGRASNGVPTGLQIVGRPYCDGDVFRAGLAFETAVGGWYRDAAGRPVL